MREAVGSQLSTGEVTPGNRVQLEMLGRVWLGLLGWAQREASGELGQLGVVKRRQGAYLTTRTKM